MLVDDPITSREASVEAPPPGEPAPARPPAARRLIVGALALAALSLLAPSAPTYDPYAWIIWGREILQLDLVTTTGPSWKPLPVLFTTVFALFGDAAPSLWLVVARAGALLGVALAYALARQLGAGRPAAGAAAAALATAPWWTVNGWLGNSEGLLVACLLGACLLHLQGRRAPAFGLAVAAGLLRPEAWPFLGLYGLWLAWHHPGMRRLVAGGFALLPVLWLLPEQWGSGDLWRASTRAQTELAPDAAGRADQPALQILRDFDALLPAAIWLGIIAAAIAAAVAARRGRTAWPVAGLAMIAASWVGLVALMATSGYSGNERYLIAPAAIAIVLAGAGAGAVLRGLPRLARPVAAVGVLLAFALGSTRDTLDAAAETGAQSRITGDLAAAVERAGGNAAVQACGPLVTEPLLVPQVAWRFGLHLDEVFHAQEPGGPDAAVLRAQISPHLRPYPPASRYAGRPQRTLSSAPRWRIFVVGRCAR